MRGNTRKRRRTGVSTPGSERLAATAANQVWAIDFQVEITSDGRTLKLCNVADEFTREALPVDVGRGFDADATDAVLDRIAAHRGAPNFVRCDKGPQLCAAALRDRPDRDLTDGRSKGPVERCRIERSSLSLPELIAAT